MLFKAGGRGEERLSNLESMGDPAPPNIEPTSASSQVKEKRRHDSLALMDWLTLAWQEKGERPPGGLHVSCLQYFGFPPFSLFAFRTDLCYKIHQTTLTFVCFSLSCACVPHI